MRRFGFYEYSCLIWCVNIVLIILSYFINGLIYLAPLFFIAVLISYGGMIHMEKWKEHFGLDRIFKYSTTCSKTIALMSIIYAFLNGFICGISLFDGSPHIDNGVYCLWNHGFIREITKEEYDALMIVEGRLFIGYYLVFSAIPIVYFSARKNILDSQRQ